MSAWESRRIRDAAHEGCAGASGSGAIVRLLTFMSPAFPVGAFAYSHGLEEAVAAGVLRNADGVSDWIGDLVAIGSAWNDAVVFAAAHRGEAHGDDLAAIGELAEAMAASGERHLETMAQGRAFTEAAGVWFGREDGPGLAYPVSVARACVHAGLALEPALAAFLQGFATNLVQAAMRLVPLGQSQGVRILARLEPVVLDSARRAAESSLDDLGSATIMADIGAMRHETVSTRLFRT